MWCLVDVLFKNAFLFSDDFDRPRLPGKVKDDYINAVFVDVSYTIITYYKVLSESFKTLTKPSPKLIVLR